MVHILMCTFNGDNFLYSLHVWCFSKTSFIVPYYNENEFHHSYAIDGNALSTIDVLSAIDSSKV